LEKLEIFQKQINISIPKYSEFFPGTEITTFEAYILTCNLCETMIAINFEIGTLLVNFTDE